MNKSFAFYVIVSLWASSLFGADAEVSASVDWMQEVVNGGVTSVALGILCLASVAILVERFLQLKIDHFAPKGMAEKAMSLWRSGGAEAIVRLAQEKDAVLSKIILFALKHHKAEPDMIYSGASDIIHRSMRKENIKNTLLAVSAALAPLLGLLGTMIGMIESFKLVELYGDEGGASMLAGSISKALITTAVGLIIAIMALVAYHGYRLKISALTLELEETVEELLNAWFLPAITLPKTAGVTPEGKKAGTTPQGKEEPPKKREATSVKKGTSPKA